MLHKGSSSSSGQQAPLCEHGRHAHLGRPLHCQAALQPHSKLLLFTLQPPPLLNLGADGRLTARQGRQTGQQLGTCVCLRRASGRAGQRQLRCAPEAGGLYTAQQVISAHCRSHRSSRSCSSRCRRSSSSFLRRSSSSLRHHTYGNLGTPAVWLRRYTPCCQPPTAQLPIQRPGGQQQHARTATAAPLPPVPPPAAAR